MAVLDQAQAQALTRKLAKQLADDRPKLDMLERYYCGDQPLAFASAKFREAFGGLFKASAVNWMPLVISAVLERLHVEGFRAPDKADAAAMWDIWQGNFLDAESQIGHTEALKFGRGYIGVGEDDDPDMPLITVESTRDVTHLMSSSQRRKRAAGLRVFTDDDGALCSTLYTPEQVWRWQRKKGSQTLLSAAVWEPRIVRDAAGNDRPWPEPNTLGVVPLIPLLARPGVDRWGVSELAEVLPIQDMVNKTVADLLVASEFTALPQRWVTGLDIVVDPVTGQQKDPFPALTRLMQGEDPNTQFGQFAAGDLSNYVSVLETFKQDVATLSRTPPHYFYLSGQFPSGESIKSAETGLVAKAHERMLTFGEAWEEAAVLALVIKTGDQSKLQLLRSVETIWGDPEYRTEGEHVDATLKKQALGVPWEQLMEDLGYSPPQIQRMSALRDAEQAKAAAAQALMFGTAGPQGGTAPPVPTDGSSVAPKGSVVERTDAKFAPPTVT